MTKQTGWIILLTLILGNGAGTVDAGPNWKSLIPFTKRVEAHPHKSYEIGEEDGPWMILASTFAGEGAQQQAHDLVMELRREHNLPAYVHKRRFDYSKPVIGLGLNRFGGPKRMRHKHNDQFEQHAVLVGNFDSVDDAEVQRVLDKIKYLRPKTLDLTSRKQTSQRFAVFREIQKYVSPNAELRKRGPMGSAFVTRNPLLPDEYFAPQGLDSFVLQMNKGVKHSLLDNPGQYSVRVATFRGESTMELAKMDGSQQRSGQPSKLELAAQNAHDLTMALRKKGVEAYEFHDRFESIVTVGDFESVGQPRPDGRIEINPAVHQIMQTYGARRTPIGPSSAGLQPRTLNGIPFDVQPIPVEVPRASVAANYSRSPYRE